MDADNTQERSKSGHRPAVFVAAYLATLSVLGLICLLARLHAFAADGDDEGLILARMLWGLGLVAAAGFMAGWAVTLATPMAYAFSQSGFAVGPAAAYLVSQTGAVILYGPAGIHLGATLIGFAFAIRATLPTWLFWVTVIAGVLGLASLAFFPWFALPIWGIIIGVWLLTVDRRA